MSFTIFIVFRTWRKELRNERTKSDDLIGIVLEPTWTVESKESIDWRIRSPEAGSSFFGPQSIDLDA